jgi:hypothetical protein
MVYCPKCGKELPADTVFCDRCGQKMDAPVKSPSGHWESRLEERLERRFQRYDYSPDYLEGVGFGVFLIAVAWVYLQFPWVWGEVTAWLRTWVGGPTILPIILTEPIALFFFLMGGWGLVEGSLRIVSGRVLKGLGNIISALGGIAIGYLVNLYGQGTINGSDIPPIFITIIGASVVLHAILASMTMSYSSRRH